MKNIKFSQGKSCKIKDPAYVWQHILYFVHNACNQVIHVLQTDINKIRLIGN